MRNWGSLREKIKNLHAFYKSIIYLIEDIKTNLIPRTLLLSSDSEVNLALTRFDAFIRDFQEEIKYSWDLPETSNLIALLLDELASVYDVLQRKMPPSDGDNPYRFKVPSPFYWYTNMGYMGHSYYCCIIKRRILIGVVEIAHKTNISRIWKLFKSLKK